MVVPHRLDLLAGSTVASHAGGTVAGDRVAVLVALVSGMTVLSLVLHSSYLRRRSALASLSRL